MAKTETSKQQQRPSVIDCDVHNTIVSETVLYPYLSERWRKHHGMVGTTDRVGAYIPRAHPFGARYDAWTPSGTSPRDPILVSCVSSYWTHSTSNMVSSTA